MWVTLKYQTQIPDAELRGKDAGEIEAMVRAATATCNGRIEHSYNNTIVVIR